MKPFAHTPDFTCHEVWRNAWNMMKYIRFANSACSDFMIERGIVLWETVSLSGRDEVRYLENQAFKCAKLVHFGHGHLSSSRRVSMHKH